MNIVIINKPNKEIILLYCWGDKLPLPLLSLVFVMDDIRNLPSDAILKEILLLE